MRIHRYVKSEWKASKRETTQKYKLAKTKTKEIKCLVKTRWKSLMDTDSLNNLQLTSPVLQLHSTNDAPSDEEVKLVLEALRFAEREKQHYLDEMERRAVWELLENEVQPKPVELKLIDQFVADLKGVVSPLRRLPPEILQSIFLRGSYDHDMRTCYSPKYYHLEAAFNQRLKGATYWPWTLSQVCRGWRQVCLATPELWNYLPALVLKRVQSARDKRREKHQFSLMVKRSRNSPLNVFIYGLGFVEETHPIFWMLIQESDRWETMTLKLSWPTFSAVMYPIKHRLRNLRYLAFCLKPDETRLIPITWDVFSNAPCLRHVCFHTWVPPEDQMTIPGPEQSLPRAIDTFVNNPNLHTLTLSIYLNVPIPSAISLPNLKRLKLTVLENTVPCTIDAITAPALEEFALFCQYAAAYNTLPTIISFIRRSIAATTTTTYPLKKLHLKVRSAPSDSLISIVEMLPQLITLEVPLTRQSTEFMERLLAVDPLRIIAPNLQFCNFHSLRLPTPFLYDALNQLAKMRCYESLSSGTVLSCTVEEGDVRLFKRLKSLTLECETVHILRKHQHLLEEANDPNRSQQRLDEEDSFNITLSSLEGLAELLYDVTSESATGNRSWVPCTVRVTEKFTRASAKGILEELQTRRFEDVNVRDIYIPQVHLRLQAIAKWIEVNVTKVKRKSKSAVYSDLHKAIQDTLEKWYFALDEYTSSIHWAAISTTVLMYIPSDDPFRSSSNSINLARVYDASVCLKPFYDVFSEGLISDDAGP